MVSKGLNYVYCISFELYFICGMCRSESLLTLTALLWDSYVQVWSAAKYLGMGNSNSSFLCNGPTHVIIIQLFVAVMLHCMSMFFTTRENRYLLILTENYAALPAMLHILHNQQLKAQERQPQAMQRTGDQQQKAGDLEPYVLFGSSFPQDKEFTQVSEGWAYEVAQCETGCTLMHVAPVLI